MGVPLKTIHFNRIFHYRSEKPSSYWGKTSAFVVDSFPVDPWPLPVAGAARIACVAAPRPGGRPPAPCARRRRRGAARGGAAREPKWSWVGG